ncbi:MAG TPA: pantoate--beta-alanine ligase [Bacteroidales bacterium]|nr:pantoate--beta-alanine ligase [Bacteroidales bacterium]
MEVFEHIAPLQERIRDYRSGGSSAGFVPTMGALHAGHVSLVRCSKKQNNITVVSIFVNPTQFNNKEDLIRYPRPLENDLKILQNEDCDIVFLPEEKEIYPRPDNRTFDFAGLDAMMEGKFRPGHFNGVARVVTRLFEIVKPDRAYFGYKDFQQLVIIRHVTNMLKIPVEIVSCPIVREKDSLAMSSRNVRLSDSERKVASEISHVLFDVRDSYRRFSSVEAVKEHVFHWLSGFPQLQVEYFEMVDEKTLQPVSGLRSSAGIVCCIAVWVGKVRLIDNVNINS